MEAIGFFIPLSVVSSFAAAMLCVPPLFESLRRVVLTGRLQANSSDGVSFLGKLMRNGIAWSKPLTVPVLASSRLRALFEDSVLVLRARRYDSTPKNLCSVWLAAVLVVIGVGTLLGASVLFGVAAALCFSVASRMAINREKDKQRERLSDGVPDAIRSMSVCFRAGLSLLQTFQHIASEASDPLKTLFLRAAHALETGSTAEAALGELRKNASVPELAFVAVALEVQHSTGGSMQQVLDAARDSIESEVELRRSLKVQTAQAKLSAQVVTAMPFVLLALFSLITEDFLGPFFSSAAGLALLGLAILMQTTGILVVRSMLKMDGE